MWRKFVGFFCRKDDPTEVSPEQEILEEVRAIKKLARKQSLLLEKMRGEFLEQSEQKLRRELEPLLAFADAFFYLDRSFRELGDLSPQRCQALEMVWQRLDGMLTSEQIRMVRQTEVPFNERVHEAIENLSPEGEELQVVDVIQPGYAHNGRVVRAARVIVGGAENNGSEKNNGTEPDHNGSETEESTEDAEDYLRD